MKFFCFCSLAFYALAATSYAQYVNPGQLTNRISALGKSEGLVKTSTLVKTAGGKDIFLITVGQEDPDNKPGVAVIGGSSPSPFSTEIVMQMVERLILTRPSLLDEVTFYFFPDVSPDASAQFFATPKYERRENAQPYDDDRDGLTDEDGYDDLNNDGLITWMRIKDPDKGEYLIHPENPAVMYKADIKKNQHGEYILLKEGRDNDKDGKINEDLPGGVIFNKNLSFNYPYFEHGAGDNAFCAEESRALAKFLFDHWNIFAVLSIGPENNLSGYNDLKADLLDKNMPASVDEKDKPYFESVVEVYKKMARLNDSSLTVPAGGSFLSWVYFHYNRFSFSTPAWNVNKNKNNLGSTEFDYLKLASDKGLSDQTIPWQRTDHPDFPGRMVEIGGIRPFVAANPPQSWLDTITGQHLEFLTALAAMHPAMTFNDLKITRSNDLLYQIEVEVTNTGRLPTMTVLGLESKWVRKIRLELIVPSTCKVMGGRKVFLFDRIVPGETAKAAWLVNGKGKISLKAGSPQSGFVSREIELK